MRGATRIQGAHSDRNSRTGALQALARLAAAQHGVVSLNQLRWLGFSEWWIKRRIASGYLIRVQRSVYAVGHARLTREGHWMAAVLTYGDGASLSHLSAAAHWGLLRTSAAKIDVALPSHRDVSARPSVRVHRTRLHPSDRLVRHNIPVTSPMRTLLDLADVVSTDRVRHAYEQSHRAGLYDLDPLEALLARSSGRRGLKVLRKLIAEGNSDPPDLRSGLEQAFLDLIRAEGLPLPDTNVIVEGLLVDCHWPAHNLVVELDSYSYHRSNRAFEQDHEGTERLQRAGQRVLRFTDRRINADPKGVMETVRLALAARLAAIPS